MSRIQTTRGGPDMYQLRCCPISLGIVCREIYDETKHQGEDIVEDPYDKRQWAERQINWIITQAGSPILVGFSSITNFLI